MNTLEQLDTETLKTTARNLPRVQTGKRKGLLTKSAVQIAEKISAILMARGIYWEG